MTRKDYGGGDALDVVDAFDVENTGDAPNGGDNMLELLAVAHFECDFDARSSVVVATTLKASYVRARAADDHACRDLHGLHGLLAGWRGQAPEGDAGQP